MIKTDEEVLFRSGLAPQTEGNEGFKKITREIGPYSITVVLTVDNQFVGIQDVGKAQNFMDHRQRAALVKVHDIESFFEDAPKK